MRKLLLLLLLLLCASAYSQNSHKVGQAIQNLQTANTQFRHHDVFTGSKSSDTRFTGTLERATTATLDQVNTGVITAAADDHISIVIPYNDSELALLLYKVNIATEDFTVDTDKVSNVAFEKGVHYRGIISGDFTSVVSMNFFRGELSGIISSSQLGNIVVGKLNTPSNSTDYIIYAEKDLKAISGFKCVAPDLAVAQQYAPEMNRMSVMSNRCVTVYFEIDYDMYVANGSNVNQTIIWMQSVFNNVQTLFANDNITTAIKSVFVWTVPDPYFGEFSYEYLYQFNDLRPTFNGDVGQLIGIDSGLGGVAAVIDGLCSENNFSYSDVYFDYNTVPVFSWTVQVITHELGHLYGSPHTHACTWNGNNSAIDGCGPTANINYAEGNCIIADIPSGQTGGTIMSYCHLIGEVGINFANGFGTQPANRMFNNIESSLCLSTDCTNTCINQSHSITVTNVTATSALVSWTDPSGASTWEITAVSYPFDPILWDVTANNPHTLNNLDPNKYYKFFVRPACSNMIAMSTSSLFATNDDFCSGKLFTDTGGADNFYGNGENWTRIIMPANSVNKVKVVFNSINIEYDYDFLYIYNGPDTSANEMTGGGITGTAAAGPFESTHESGALTFQFISDQYLTAPGWNATLSCTNLGIGENELVDFSYYPNPAKDQVSIVSPNQIQEVSVFSLDGKLLYDAVLHANDTKVDISRFASGTYIFRLKFENSEGTFKILKQ